MREGHRVLEGRGGESTAHPALALRSARLIGPALLYLLGTDVAAGLTIRAQGIVVRQTAAAHLALLERRERLHLFVQHGPERWLVFLQPTQQQQRLVGCQTDLVLCVGDCDAALIVVGDTVHNFVDGVLIAAAFVQSTELGVVTAVAIGFPLAGAWHAVHTGPVAIGSSGRFGTYTNTL